MRPIELDDYDGFDGEVSKPIKVGGFKT